MWTAGVFLLIPHGRCLEVFGGVLKFGHGSLYWYFGRRFLFLGLFGEKGCVAEVEPGAWVHLGHSTGQTTCLLLVSPFGIEIEWEYMELESNLSVTYLCCDLTQ